MKIAILHLSFQTLGGAEVLACQQARYLRETGADVNIYTWTLGEGAPADVFANLAVRMLPKRAATEIFYFWDRTAKTIARTRRMARHLRDADLTLAHNAPASAMLGHATIPGRKLWYCHEPPRSLYPDLCFPYLHQRVIGGERPSGIRHWDTLAAYYQRWLRDAQNRPSVHRRRTHDLAGVRGLDGIVANSEASRRSASAIYGFRHIPVVPPMVRFPTDVAHRAGLNRSGLRILVHSRLELLKNVETVLDAFHRFRTSTCPDAELHIVGRGDRAEALLRQVADLQEQAHVYFHGFLPQDELERIYAHCDVMALAPLDEPFGLVFPEAAARGLLLVGSDHGGPAEILEGGRLGATVDPLAPDAMAEAFARVWRMTDGEVDHRRRQTDSACRARYSESVIGPLLVKTLGV